MRSRLRGATGAAGEVGRAPVAEAAAWLVPPLLGLAAVLYATSTGIGLTMDSAAYIGAARGLLLGAGIADGPTQGPMQPMTYYAPLTSVLIATVSRAGTDPFTAARWLNAILLAVNVALAMALIRYDTGSRRWASFGGLALCSSVTFLMPHSIAWSEPTFLACSFAAIAGLARYLEHGDRRVLIAAAAAAGLGGMARYAGAELIAAGAASLMMRPRRRRRGVVRDAAIWVMVSALPPLSWVARNCLVTGVALTRGWGWHPVPLARWWTGLGTVGHFLALRGSWTGRVLAVGALALFASLALQRRRRLGELVGALPPVASTALVFTVTHVAFLVASATLVDASLAFDPRLLGPAYVWGLVGGICALARWSRDASWTASDRALLTGALGAFAAAHLLNAMPWVIDAHRNGQGFTRPEWRASELMARVRKLPPEVVVYSNGAPVIQLLLDRPADRLPDLAMPMLDAPNPYYDLELEHMRRRLAESHGVVVYFTTLTWLWHFPAADQLTRDLGLRALYQASDGTMYGLPDGGPTNRTGDDLNGRRAARHTAG